MAWKDVWLSNYNGTSDYAKELDKHMKQNYKGHNYLPWAVLQRLLYLMDDDASIHVLDTSNEGKYTPLMTESFDVRSLSVDPKKGTEEVSVLRHVHFVSVKVKFLGKTFTEKYPVQDNTYNAPNVVDSNMVNKAVQRAKARCISAATGLGWSLYETGDLQFEDDTPPKTLVPPTVTRTVKTIDVAKAVEPPVVSVETDTKSADMTVIGEIVSLIKSGNPVIPEVLHKLNPSFLKKYKFTLSVDMDDKVLTTNLSQIPSPDQTLSVMKMLLGTAK